MISKARRMARGIDRGLDFNPCERGRLFSKIFSQTIPGALALALSALFGVWILYLRPAAAPYAVEAPAAAPAVALASNPYGGLFDPRSSSGSTPVSLAKNFPLESNLKPVPPAPSAAIAERENVLPAPAGAQFGESAPLPVPRPTELGSLESHSPFPASGRRLAQQNRRIVPPTTLADKSHVFRKAFWHAPTFGACPCLCGAGRWRSWQCTKSHIQPAAPL